MRQLVLILLCCLPGMLRLDAAVVRSLDGQQWTVDDLRLSEGRLVVSDGTLALADVDWIQADATPPLLEPAHGLAVLLRDGSVLPATNLTTAERDDAVVVATGLGTFTFALGEEIIGWGPADWLTARAGSPVGDGEEEIDHLLLDETTWPGLVGGIADGRLLFEATATEQEVRHEIAQVDGLRLALPIEAPKGLCFQARLAADLPSAWFRLGADGWQLAIGDQLLAEQPQQRLVAQGGRRVWLGSLEPVAEETVQRGAFGVVWPYTVDSNLDGSPLELGGRRYARGLVAHSQARLVWDLDEGFERFSCLLGIADLVGREGDCLVSILGDGKPLLPEQRLRGGEEPRPVELDLRGVDRLVLNVAFGERYDIGDHVALANAWLLRTTGD